MTLVPVGPVRRIAERAAGWNRARAAPARPGAALPAPATCRPRILPRPRRTVAGRRCPRKEHVQPVPARSAEAATAISWQRPAAPRRPGRGHERLAARDDAGRPPRIARQVPTKRRARSAASPTSFAPSHDVPLRSSAAASAAATRAVSLQPITTARDRRSRASPGPGVSSRRRAAPAPTWSRMRADSSPAPARRNAAAARRETSRIADRRTRSDGREVVAGDIGQRQRETSRGAARAARAVRPDRRDVLPHRVHGLDRKRHSAAGTRTAPPCPPATGLGRCREQRRRPPLIRHRTVASRGSGRAPREGRGRVEGRAAGNRVIPGQDADPARPPRSARRPTVAPRPPRMPPARSRRRHGPSPPRPCPHRRTRMRAAGRQTTASPRSIRTRSPCRASRRRSAGGVHAKRGCAWMAGDRRAKTAPTSGPLRRSRRPRSDGSHGRRPCGAAASPRAPVSAWQVTHSQG